MPPRTDADGSARDAGAVAVTEHDRDPATARERVLMLLVMAAFAGGAFALTFDVATFWSGRPTFYGAATVTTAIAAPLALVTGVVARTAGRTRWWLFPVAAGVFLVSLAHRLTTGLAWEGRPFAGAVALSFAANVAFGAFIVRERGPDQRDVADPLAEEWFRERP